MCKCIYSNASEFKEFCFSYLFYLDLPICFENDSQETEVIEDLNDIGAQPNGSGMYVTIFCKK